MKFKLALILCSICLVVNISYAGYFEDDFLESIKLVDENGGNGDGHISGRKISTYEDVDDLVIKPKSTLNAEFINYADIPSGPTLETKAEKILERFDKANYTVVSKRIKNINKFLDEYLCLEEQLTEEQKNDSSREPLTLGANGNRFPYKLTAEDTARPGNISYNLGLTLNGDKYWWNEGAPNIAPDSSSCRLGICKCTQRGRAHHNKIDAYKDFRKTLLATMNKGENVEAKNSQSKIEINFADRTPPLIKYEHGTVNESGLPTVSDEFSATTGDKYQLQGIYSADNSGKECGFASDILIKHVLPSEYAERASMLEVLLKSEMKVPGLSENKRLRELMEKKDIEKAKEDNSASPGYMGYERMTYWYQTWDQATNLNPSESSITENVPNECYRHLDWKSLSTHWCDTASNSAFPLHVNLEGFPKKKVYEKNNSSTDLSYNKGVDTDEYDLSIKYIPEGVGYESSVKQGKVEIVDNDLPNLVVRLQCSSKGDEVIYFPPVVDNIKFKNSVVFYNPDKTAFILNRQEYWYFISGINEFTQRYFDYNYIDQFPSEENIFYRIIKATPRNQLIVDPDEVYKADVENFKKLSKETNPAVLQKLVRIENFGYSDKLTPITFDTDYMTLGERCGTGATMSVLINLSEHDYVYVRQNADYIIDIFADDNLKWTKKVDEKGKELDEYIPLHTGIKSGKITVTIPNEKGELDVIELKKEDYDTEKAVNGGLKVRFERPTPLIFSHEEETMVKNFPCVEATVTDYSDLTRTIKLYLRVISESGSSRAIEEIKPVIPNKIVPYHENEELQTIEKLK